MPPPFPVLDLFAGPGGLGEGFAASRNEDGSPTFRIALSIERDLPALQTLQLRAAFRRLREIAQTDPYYDYVRGTIKQPAFLDTPVVAAAMADAKQEAKHAELGKTSSRLVDTWIKSSIGDATNWVLVGGPPCQAYSLAGRSRRANDAEFEEDEKHLLYREYLRILRAHAPPVFVMENVKGLLTSTYRGAPMFSRIFQDLNRPSRDLRYEIRSFVKPDVGLSHSPEDYVIECEHHGVPQRRHRVIMLGVREDRASRRSSLLEILPETSVRAVIGDLPRLRSRLSSGVDSPETWKASLQATGKALVGWRNPEKAAVLARINDVIASRRLPRSSGGAFIARNKRNGDYRERLHAWLADPVLGGVVQHETRSHIPEDLQRYLFASCFAEITGVSPRIPNFPDAMLPNHQNVRNEDVPFRDRFRVQLGPSPSTTVVSHIAKDGHYYIHFDPTQCRSLTVREAARLQTFPDNYFFEGNRTQQYTQVGNAVPPYLAVSLARVVAELLGSRTPTNCRTLEQVCVEHERV